MQVTGKIKLGVRFLNEKNSDYNKTGTFYSCVIVTDTKRTGYAAECATKTIIHLLVLGEESSTLILTLQLHNLQQSKLFFETFSCF